MKKIIYIILSLFLVFNINSSFANLTIKQQENYKNQVNKVFLNFENQISKTSKEKQIEKLNTILSKINIVLNKKISEKNKFVIEYLKTLIVNKISKYNTYSIKQEAKQQEIFNENNSNLENKIISINNNEKEINDFVLNLTKWITNEEEKIKVIFQWITTNIKYNQTILDLYNSDKTESEINKIIADKSLCSSCYNWYETFKTKNWVCEWYTQLFDMMLKSIWIKDTEIISWIALWTNNRVWSHSWNRIWNYYYDTTRDKWTMKWYKLPKDIFYSTRTINKYDENLIWKDFKTLVCSIYDSNYKNTSIRYNILDNCVKYTIDDIKSSFKNLYILNNNYFIDNSWNKYSLTYLNNWWININELTPEIFLNMKNSDDIKILKENWIIYSVNKITLQNIKTLEITTFPFEESIINENNNTDNQQWISTYKESTKNLTFTPYEITPNLIKWSYWEKRAIEVYINDKYTTSFITNLNWDFKTNYWYSSWIIKIIDKDSWFILIETDWNYQKLNFYKE